MREMLNQILADYHHACRSCEEEETTLSEAVSRVGEVEKAQALVQHVAETVQASAHKQIAAVVSRCLESVFENDCYQFHIDFAKARGKTEARLQFIREGMVLDDPLNSSGGGVVDLASFALRLATLVLARPRRRKLLCLDEPFKHLSKEYVPAARQMLLILAKEMGIQIVMVTHNPELQCGKVIEI